MPVVKNIPIPPITRPTSSALDALEVGDALILPVTDLNTALNRRRMQARVTSATKRLGYRFSIRVITSPLDGVDVELPAIGAWRIV